MEIIASLVSGGGVWVVAGIIGVGAWVIRGHYDNKSALQSLNTHFEYLRKDVDKVLAKLDMNGSS